MDILNNYHSILIHPGDAVAWVNDDPITSKVVGAFNYK